ncbi:methyltransferase domain-containing protein, partial [Burkholderia cenocepacia]|uniref:methyltransferase domain-containing protein n=1 Tax=Burkholderia cenocepacia TaxID=95486 RepID=UPI000F5BBF23
QSNYDVIALYSVLEHIPDPASFLRELKRFCPAETLVFIRVPKMSEAGPWLSLLDHFWHFSETGLGKLLDYCGYQTLESYPSGVFHG